MSTLNKVTLIGYLGRDSADTFFYMGILFAALFMATATFLYRFSWERHMPGGAAPVRSGFSCNPPRMPSNTNPASSTTCAAQLP